MLLKFAIGDQGLTNVNGRPIAADIQYKGLANRFRAGADSVSKVCSIFLSRMIMQLQNTLKFSLIPLNRFTLKFLGNIENLGAFEENKEKLICLLEFFPLKCFCFLIL